MSIVRVGSNKKYAEGWEKIFGGRKGTESKKASGSGKAKKAAGGKKKK